MSPGRQKGFFFFWARMTQFSSPIISSPKAVTPTMSPTGREMFPVLSPSAGALGTTGSRTDMLAAVLGPGVGSMGWDFVDAAWGLRAKLVVTRREGSTDEQTASMLALPGMAVDSQNRWGLQVSVDDVVSEKVPGAQAAHTTFDVGVPGLTTPKPGRHLRSGAHAWHLCGLFSTQYQPGLQAHTRFCIRVQA